MNVWFILSTWNGMISKIKFMTHVRQRPVSFSWQIKQMYQTTLGKKNTSYFFGNNIDISVDSTCWYIALISELWKRGTLICEIVWLLFHLICANLEHLLRPIEKALMASSMHSPSPQFERAYVIEIPTIKKLSFWACQGTGLKVHTN